MEAVQEEELDHPRGGSHRANPRDVAVIEKERDNDVYNLDPHGGHRGMELYMWVSMMISSTYFHLDLACMIGRHFHSSTS